MPYQTLQCQDEEQRCEWASLPNAERDAEPARQDSHKPHEFVGESQVSQRREEEKPAEKVHRKFLSKGLILSSSDPHRHKQIKDVVHSSLCLSRGPPAAGARLQQVPPPPHLAVPRPLRLSLAHGPAADDHSSTPPPPANEAFRSSFLVLVTKAVELCFPPHKSKRNALVLSRVGSLKVS
ncbi:hypothetical protein PsorP6_001572 [Peronosclerospora sorghi]|uniref:Uncharacterized protein n=1 Tax=Peronosclerospora sorghi TaxID=230839 RepID=A0ACC0WTZ1_9STRA|nr:hypothetical protein PsorP6_001572 [Peronosclerospora sorghi]